MFKGIKVGDLSLEQSLPGTRVKEYAWEELLGCCWKESDTLVVVMVLKEFAHQKYN